MKARADEQRKTRSFIANPQIPVQPSSRQDPSYRAKPTTVRNRVDASFFTAEAQGRRILPRRHEGHEDSADVAPAGRYKHGVFCSARAFIYFLTFFFVTSCLRGLKNFFLLCALCACGEIPFQVPLHLRTLEKQAVRSAKTTTLTLSRTVVERSRGMTGKRHKKAGLSGPAFRRSCPLQIQRTAVSGKLLVEILVGLCRATGPVHDGRLEEDNQLSLCAFIRLVTEQGA